MIVILYVTAALMLLTVGWSIVDYMVTAHVNGREAVQATQRAGEVEMRGVE